MKYRAMFCDTFFDVEAESEKEAQFEALKELILELLEDEEPFIVWEAKE